MQEIGMAEMQSIDGGGWGEFFTGVACGATAIGALAAWVSPEPLSKIAAYELTLGAVTCIGAIAAS